MTDRRRKGAAIVDTPKGVLVVASRNKKFMLPGGGANHGESRRNAAIRELYEETRLKTKSSKYLFGCVGHKWKTHQGQIVRNHTHIFLIKAIGTPKPSHEIKHIAFWKPGSHVHITEGTKEKIEKYLTKYKH